MEAERRAAKAMEFKHADATAMGEQGRPGRPASQGGSPGAPTGVAPHTPFVRDERKVGRNEPCPCGSGKKFKQCHGRLS